MNSAYRYCEPTFVPIRQLISSVISATQDASGTSAQEQNKFRLRVTLTKPCPVRVISSAWILQAGCRDVLELTARRGHLPREPYGTAPFLSGRRHSADTDASGVDEFNIQEAEERFAIFVA